MFMHSPEVAERVAHLGAYVRFEGTLDMKVRVLAAMTVAREFKAMYVWGAQTGQARAAGRARGNDHRDPPEPFARHFPARRGDRRVHAPAVAQASRRRRAVQEAAYARFGNDQLVQLTTAIGYYTLLGMTVNACELEPAADAEVLDLNAVA